MIKHLFLPARFLISGSIGAVVNLGLLFSLTSWLGLWYLYSAIISFTLATSVSFTLQKFWTFKEGSMGRIPRQMSVYLMLALFNLVTNTLFLYLAVDWLGLHYLISQMAISGLIAVWNFFIYQVIFYTADATSKVSHPVAKEVVKPRPALED